jgi:hypothetical protein
MQLLYFPILSYLRSCALLEKQLIVQLLKDFQHFMETERFITVFTRALHRSLSCARSIESIPSHPMSPRSILIFSTHLLLGLSNGRFPSGFPTNILYAFLFTPPFLLHALPISSSLTLSFSYTALINRSL